MRAFGCSLLVLLLLLTCAAEAQTRSALPVYVPPPSVGSATPSNLAVGNQYYDASVSGLGEYVKTLRLTQPAAAAELEPALHSLRVRRTLGIATMVGGVAAGLVLMLSPLFKSGSDENCFASAEQAACMEREDAALDKSMTMIYAGVGVMLVVPMVGYAIMPGRRALLSFINQHNRLLPGSPIRLQIGYDPKRHVAAAGLRWQL